MQKEIVVARSWGQGEWGVTASGAQGSFWGDENVLELHQSVNVLNHTELHILQRLILRYMNFTSTICPKSSTSTNNSLIVSES